MEYGKEYNEYLAGQSRFRKFVRKFYLEDIKKNLIGKTIDFGCGTGELLSQLPDGSIGFEINPFSVELCNQRGLDVRIYDLKDDYKLNSLSEKENFTSFSMNHVLEHTDEPAEIIKKIFNTCDRLNIQRIVFTVPGKKGFDSDKTHITSVDKELLKNEGIFDSVLYQIKRTYYFPINTPKFSKIFTHNELRLVFERKKR